jgi:hypothetical protein
MVPTKNDTELYVYIGTWGVIVWFTTEDRPGES